MAICCPEKQTSGLQSFSHVFDGFNRTFRIYFPKQYAAGEKLPLLITLHGGDYARAHLRTSWHLLAEEKGFLVLYPESLREGVMWNAWNTLSSQDGRADDISFLDQLIAEVCQRFPIDESRVFLHGQSMGDMFGEHYAFVHPNRIAAAFLCSGPTKTKWWLNGDGTRRFLPAGPCPVMRLHGERDCFSASGISPIESMLYKQQCHIDLNARCWLEVNQCKELAACYTGPRYSAAKYSGDAGCDYISLMVKDGVHRPPADTERIAYEYFFSGWRLENGRHVPVPPLRTERPDTAGIALAAGAQYRLVDGQKISLMDHAPQWIDSALYIDEHTAKLLKQRLHLPASAGFSARTDPLQLFPFCEWIHDAAGYHAQEFFGAAYAVKHPFALSFDFAYLLRQELNVQAALSTAEAYRLEDRIYRMQAADAGFEPPKNREEEVWQWGHTV